MAGTFTFTADNIGAPEPIVVQTVCKRVTVRQQSVADGTVSQMYRIRAPLATSPAVLKAVGEPTEFLADGDPPQRGFPVGATIAFIETLTGAETFVQQED
ncbi:MAG: hypothetical protein ACREVZ_12050 [Burkholderiales bacterium]